MPPADVVKTLANQALINQVVTNNKEKKIIPEIWQLKPKINFINIPLS
jgi:hypothetical protein